MSRKLLRSALSLECQRRESEQGPADVEASMTAGVLTLPILDMDRPLLEGLNLMRILSLMPSQ